MFDQNLYPKYGIFYVGWRNYLLSKILTLDTTFVKAENYKNIFIEQCEVIRNALGHNHVPYLESYNNQSWPADMIVAMASISNHDKIYKAKYEIEINGWIDDIKNTLDPKTKLIPHKVNSHSSEIIEGARGSSISLIIRLLAEIDYQFAKDQFQRYKLNFVSTTLGLPSIREYPKGQSGNVDIDSGPVILGVGFSGTIVSIGTFSKLDDLALAEEQYKTINAFGFGYISKDFKKYVFGKMPIADAFIAWGRATGLNNKNQLKHFSHTRQLKFHFYSITVLTMIWILFFAKKYSQKWRN